MWRAWRVFYSPHRSLTKRFLLRIILKASWWKFVCVSASTGRSTPCSCVCSPIRESTQRWWAITPGSESLAWWTHTYSLLCGHRAWAASGADLEPQTVYVWASSLCLYLNQDVWSSVKMFSSVIPAWSALSVVNADGSREVRVWCVCVRVCVFKLTSWKPQSHPVFCKSFEANTNPPTAEQAICFKHSDGNTTTSSLLTSQPALIHTRVLSRAYFNVLWSTQQQHELSFL